MKIKRQPVQSILDEVFGRKHSSPQATSSQSPHPFLVKEQVRRQKKIPEPAMSPSRNLAPGIIAALLPLVAAAPCDIYGSNGTPCVAAHSTTRSLFSDFNSPLYQVQREDGTTQDISPVSAGGIADGGAQDSFCSGTTCVISAGM